MPIAVMIGYLFVISVFLIYSFEESIYSSSNENGIAEKIKFVSTKAKYYLYYSFKIQPQ